MAGLSERGAIEAESPGAVLGALNRIFSGSWTSPTEGDFVQLCLEAAGQLTEAAGALLGEAVAVLGTEAGALAGGGGVSWTVRGSCPRPDASETAAVLRDLCGRVLRDGEGLIANGLGPAEGETDDLDAASLRCFVGAPLARGGRVGGVIGLCNRPDGFRPQDLQALQALAPAILDALAGMRARTAAHGPAERLRQFAEASQDVLWIRDAATLQWTDLSPAFETIYGLSRGEALSGDTYRNWLELIVPEDRRKAADAFARVRAGENVAFEYRIRRPRDGVVRWLRNTDFPIRDEQGRVAFIGGVGHDMTELHEAERRLRTLMEGIPQLVWRAGRPGEWTWASPQWTAFTGQPQAESHGWGWLEPLHPDDRDGARTAWAAAPARGEFEVDYRLRRVEDGSYRWFHTRAEPVVDDLGGVAEWLGTSTDVQDLRALQERQQVLVHELQHRVRNTLAVVRSITSRTGEASATVEDFASHLEGRLDALARTQVVLTRTLDGGVDLEGLVREELLAQAARDAQVELGGPEVRLSPKVAEVLALALHELATNAVKYGAFAAAEGRVSVRWAVFRKNGGRWLRLTWAESGVRVVSAAPRRRGFGAELIETRVPYELRGEGVLEFQPGGVRCRIEFPLQPGGSILQTNPPGGGRRRWPA